MKQTPTDAAPTVAPLHCSTCGSPVPLGDGDTTRCHYCQIDIAVPPELRALRATDRAADADRAHARALYARYGKGHPLLIRLLGDTWSYFLMAGAAIVLASLAFGILDFLLVDWGEGAGALLVDACTSLFVFYGWIAHALAPALGTDLLDAHSALLCFVFISAFWVIAFVFPMSLALYADRFKAVLASLASALAARPPTRKGGPSECRECGAALDVPNGALGVRCIYCGADNLVAIDRSLLHNAEEGCRSTHRHIEDAAADALVAASDRSELKDGCLLAAILTAVGCLLGLAPNTLVDNEVSLGWRGAAGANAMDPSSGDNPFLVRDTPQTIARLVVDEPPDGSDGRCGDAVACATFYFVPLHRGESLRVEGFDARYRVELQRRQPSPWYRNRWTWVGDPSLATAGAPYTGWYRLKVAGSQTPSLDAITTTQDDIKEAKRAAPRPMTIVWHAGPAGGVATAR